MTKTNELKKLEEKFADKLHNYTYLEDPSILKPGFLVKYIKKEEKTLAKGGYLTEIKYDNNNPEKIYRLKIKSNVGTEWLVKFDNIYLFYKTKTEQDIKEEQIKEWKNQMTSYEKQKYKKLSTTKNLRQTFYDWYYKRHPERKPQNKQSN